MKVCTEELPTKSKALGHLDDVLTQIISYYRSKNVEPGDFLYGFDQEMLIRLKSSLVHPGNIDLDEWDHVLRKITSLAMVQNLECDVVDIMRGLVRLKSRSPSIH